MTCKKKLHEKDACAAKRDKKSWKRPSYLLTMTSKPENGEDLGIIRIHSPSECEHSFSATLENFAR